MTLAQILELLTLLVLTATVPLAVIAIRGFEDAPFGRVLRPLPIVFLGYVAYIGPTFLDITIPIMYYAAVSTVAVIASLIAALEASLLLTGRRAI